MQGAATALLDTDDFLPAAGQGAIAITARADDAAGRVRLAAICDVDTGAALAAERAFLRVLDGSCRTPIGAHAAVRAGTLHFRGLVLRPDGSAAHEVARTGSVAEAETLGAAAGADILARLPPGFFTT